MVGYFPFDLTTLLLLWTQTRAKTYKVGQVEGKRIKEVINAADAADTLASDVTLRLPPTPTRRRQTAQRRVAFRFDGGSCRETLSAV